MASREDPKEAAPPVAVAAEKPLSRKPMQRTSSRMGLPGQLLGHYLGHRLVARKIMRQARSCQTYQSKHGSISVLDYAYDLWHIGSCKFIYPNSLRVLAVVRTCQVCMIYNIMYVCSRHNTTSVTLCCAMYAYVLQLPRWCTESSLCL